MIPKQKPLEIHGEQKEITIGSQIHLGIVKGRGGHGATIEITKVNKKTYKGIEVQGSYTPGTIWTVHKESQFYTAGRDETGKHYRQKWHNLHQKKKVEEKIHVHRGDIL